VKPNLVEERQTKRRKTEGATKTRSIPQTLERDPKPQQTKRRPPSPIPWTDLNPDWSKEWRSSIIYPPTGENRARVDKQDVGRLNEGEFLNDNLIVFYLRWLQCQLEKGKPRTAKRIFFHKNSFFYSKLTSPEKGMRGLNYAAVERWTKDDLLHYDYIIVPVNEHMHWYVAIICNAPKLLLGHNLTCACTHIFQSPPGRLHFTPIIVVRKIGRLLRFCSVSIRVSAL
jgi:sentrin-specific protease 7